MAHESTLSIAVLNIAMHAPHTPDRYIELFFDTFHNRIQKAGRGDQNVLIGALDYIDRDRPRLGVTGELYRYSQLDSTEPWFNIRNREEATEEEVSQINIPEDLKPHLSRFPFVFLAQSHRLYIEIRKYGKTTSPPALVTAFLRLFADHKLAKYGVVEVTAEPSHDALKRVLQIPFLRKLDIKIVRPNGDDHGDLKFLRRLENQHAARLEQTLSATPGETLIPDEETQSMARVAASNGYVRSTGRNSDGKSEIRSTTDMPMIKTVTYDSDLQSSNEALFQAAMRFDSDFR